MINECERRWNGSKYDAAPTLIMYTTTTRSTETKLTYAGDSKKSERSESEVITTKHHLYSLEYTSGCGEHHFGIIRWDLPSDSEMMPVLWRRSSSRFEPLPTHFFLSDVKPFMRRQKNPESLATTPDRLPLFVCDLIHKLCDYSQEQERRHEFRTEFWLRNEFNPEEPARFSIVDSRHYRSRTSDENGLMEWFVHRPPPLSTQISEGEISFSVSQSPSRAICNSEGLAGNMPVEWSPIAYETVWEKPLADEDLVRALHEFCKPKSMTWLGIYWNVTAEAYEKITLIHHGRLDRHYPGGSSGGGEPRTGFCLFIERLSMNVMLPRVAVEHRLKRLIRMSAEISNLACIPPELSDLTVSFVFF
jgi:hypothetical protein